MKSFVLTPRAENDLNQIWNYIADDNVEAADRVLDALEAAFIKLTKIPGLGHRRKELADVRHRFFMVYSYLIVYRHEAQRLEIIRVLHAARDVQSILGLAAEEFLGSSGDE
jgi:plasmid stabilization system protein ParE